MINEPSAILRISSDLQDHRLDDLIRDLARDLRGSGVETRPIQDQPKIGERGDAIALGQLALVFLSGGAATALINCLKSYLEREKTLVFEVTPQIGGRISIDAKNIDTEEIRDLLVLAQGTATPQSK